MFTLGFASTNGTAPTVVDILAAATGLVVVALQIAYLPTLYSAFNRRETEVTLLTAGPAYRPGARSCWYAPATASPCAATTCPPFTTAGSAGRRTWPRATPITRC